MRFKSGLFTVWASAAALWAAAAGVSADRWERVELAAGSRSPHEGVAVGSADCAPSAAGTGTAEPPRPAGGTAPCVNVNTGSAEALCALPGIGPVLARRILTQRSLRNGFARPEELLDVEGIGAATFGRIRTRICF